MTELAPINDQEMSRTIQSLHLSKFADLDAEGREILFPMLEAWGVNTIVLCGAWTDACIAATAYDAVDKYGYDVIMVRDGVASGTVHGEQMKSALYSAQCCEMTSK
jgi:nicotinamidase-related amidase